MKFNKINLKIINTRIYVLADSVSADFGLFPSFVDEQE